MMRSLPFNTALMMNYVIKDHYWQDGTSSNLRELNAFLLLKEALLSYVR